MRSRPKVPIRREVYAVRLLKYLSARHPHSLGGYSYSEIDSISSPRKIPRKHHKIEQLDEILPPTRHHAEREEISATETQSENSKNQKAYPSPFGRMVKSFMSKETPIYSSPPDVDMSPSATILSVGTDPICMSQRASFTSEVRLYGRIGIFNPRSSPPLPKGRLRTYASVPLAFTKRKEIGSLA